MMSLYIAGVKIMLARQLGELERWATCHSEESTK